MTREILFRETIRRCDGAFRALETEIPTPVRVPFGDSFVFRYKERTPEIVVVQKLSRISTGLKTSRALLRLGLLQELGAIFRMLDEFREDVHFMCDAIRHPPLSGTQQKFIDEFFQEEVDPSNALEAPAKRNRVRRSKVQAANAKTSADVLNPSDAQKLTKSLARSFSGYVHGSSVHILEMWGGEPPRYCLDGMLGTVVQGAFERNACHYFERSLGAFLDAAMAFGLGDRATDLKRFLDASYGRARQVSLDDVVRGIRGVGPVCGN